MDAEKDERRGLKRKISTTGCDVCEAEEAKYRCPSCQKCSCSLPCVKQHKLQSGCSGVRDRTAFIALSRFSDLDLLSDYRFLEETGRIADGPNRDTLLHAPSHHTNSAKLLLRNARAANVTLKLLPKSFSRRRKNTSFYSKTEKKLYWYLVLVFPHSNAEYSARVPEDRVLEKILSHYIHPTESDPVKQQNLKMYVVTPIDQLSVFMKSEQRLPNSLKYHELDLKKTLRENLMFKTVVEYPELHVVVKEQRCEEYRARIPDRSIISTRPSCSSEDRGAPESRTARPENETAPQSDLEEGEIRSEEEDDVKDDQNTAGNVSCAVLKNDEVSTSVDQNITRKSDDASSPPRSPNKYNEGDDLQNIAASECFFPPSARDMDNKDVEDGLNSPSLHDADCLPSCPDDVTKHASGLMEVDTAPLPDDDGGDGRTSIDQNLTKRLNETSPQQALNECDGEIKNAASSGCPLPHSHSKNIVEDVEGDLESSAVQDAACLPSCTDFSLVTSDSMEVDSAPVSLPDDGGRDEGSASIDQNLTQNLDDLSPPHALNENDGCGDIKKTAGLECLFPSSSNKNIDEDVEGPAVHDDIVYLPSCFDGVTEQSSDAVEAKVAPLTLPNNLDDKGSTSMGPNPTKNLNDPLPTSRAHVDEDVEGHIDDLDSPAVHDAVCLPFCSENVTKENSDSLKADDASQTLPVDGCDGSTCVDQNLTKEPCSSPPPSAVDRNDECLLPPSSSHNVDVEGHFGDLDSPAVQGASCLCFDGHQAD